MFEDYSEAARRVLFLARVEAGRSGSEMIEPEHVLLGLLTEDQRDWSHVFGDANIGTVYDGAVPPDPFFPSESVKRLRIRLAELAGGAAAKPDTMDLPVAEGCQTALLAAGGQAGGAEVRPLHLLWGLMNDEGSFVSRLLKSNGVTVKLIEDAIRNRQS